MLRTTLRILISPITKRVDLYMVAMLCIFFQACSPKNKTVTNSGNSSIPKTESTSKYFNVGDASIYYEVIGDGSPVLLLHGGLYGSIHEFDSIIPLLSDNHKVISVSTRGHGKSEVGTKPFSYKLFAEDAISILRHESSEKAIVIGFSDGATTAYVLASEFPSDVKKVIAMGGGISSSGYSQSGKQWLDNFSAETFYQENPDLVIERKRLMPDSIKWSYFIAQLKNTWTQPVVVSDEDAKKIKCPVLIVVGDHDNFRKQEQFVYIHQLITNSQLEIITNSGHADILKNKTVIKDVLIPFVDSMINR